MTEFSVTRNENFNSSSLSLQGNSPSLLGFLNIEMEADLENTFI